MDQSELIEPLWSMVLLNHIVGGDTLVTRESGECRIILDNGRKILMEHEATGCTQILVKVLPEARCAMANAAKSHIEVSHRLIEPNLQAAEAYSPTHHSQHPWVFQGRRDPGCPHGRACRGRCVAQAAQEHSSQGQPKGEDSSGQNTHSCSSRPRHGTRGQGGSRGVGRSRSGGKGDSRGVAAASRA